MISNLEFYEQNLKNYIKQYNIAVNSNNKHVADFIYRTSILPTSNSYRIALWTGHCIDSNCIYGINLVKPTSVIYLAPHRQIDLVLSFKN